MKIQAFPVFSDVMRNILNLNNYFSAFQIAMLGLIGLIN